MANASLTSKGQITIPVNVRHDLHLKMGDRVEFVQIISYRFGLVAWICEIGNLKERLGPAKKLVGFEDMNSTIAARGAKAP